MGTAASSETSLLPFNAYDFYNSYFLQPGFSFKLVVVNPNSVVAGIVVSYTSGYNSLPLLYSAANSSFSTLNAALTALSSDFAQLNVILFDGNYKTLLGENQIAVPNVILASYYDFRGNINKFNFQSDTPFLITTPIAGAIVNLNIFSEFFIRGDGDIVIAGCNIINNTGVAISFICNDGSRNVMLSSSVKSSNPLISLVFNGTGKSQLTIAYSDLTSGVRETGYNGSIFHVFGGGFPNDLTINSISSVFNAKNIVDPIFNPNVHIKFDFIGGNINTSNGTTDAIVRFENTTPNVDINLVSSNIVGSNKLNLKKFNKYFVLDEDANVYSNSSITAPPTEVDSNYNILPTDSTIYVYNKGKDIVLTLPNVSTIDNGKRYMITKASSRGNVGIRGDVPIEGCLDFTIPKCTKSVSLALNEDKTRWLLLTSSSFP